MDILIFTNATELNVLVAQGYLGQNVGISKAYH
jgi:hypothetical protein